MNDKPLSPLENAIRNTIMRVVFVFFPLFPRKLIRKYKKLAFSPDNLVSYITELRAQPQFESRGGPGNSGLSPDYILLQEAVQDHQADELRFSSEPIEVSLLQNHEIVIQGTDMLFRQAQTRGYEWPHDRIKQYISSCRQGMTRTIALDPIIKRWVSVVKDTPEELIIVIGPGKMEGK